MKAPLVLDGKALAKSIEEDLKVRVQIIKDKTNSTPVLATIIVGNDLENAIEKCSAYTPVPGGVGPMTINCLITQTVESAEKKLRLV